MNRATGRFSLSLLLLNFVCGVAFADILVGTTFEGGVRRIDEQSGLDLPNGVAPGRAGLAFTAGVTVGPDGNIYVSSQGTQEVLYFDGETGDPLPSPIGGRDGLFAVLATAQLPGSTPGPLRFGPDGHLYVSDFGSNLVRKFDGRCNDGNGCGQEISPPGAQMYVGPPAGLTFHTNGTLYAGDFGSGSVTRFPGGPGETFVFPGAGGLMTPSSLLFMPNGHLLVVDIFGDQILEYNANGFFVRKFAQIELDLGPSPPPGADPTDNPSDIVFDADGNLLVAVLGPTNPSHGQTYGSLLKFDRNGGEPIDEILLNQTPLGAVAWIRSVDAIPGDYNGDGNLTGSDYDKWQRDFGKFVAAGGGADGSGNGIVDDADYVYLRKIGPPPGAGLPSQGEVPEPSAATLAIFATLLALGRRRG